MTPELVKWIVASLASCTVVIVGAVVWLSVLLFRIGQKYGAVEAKLETFEEATAKLEKATEKLDGIAVIETKLSQLAESHAEERRRFASDFPALQEKVTTLWEKVFSMNEWRKSQGQYGGGGRGKQ